MKKSATLNRLVLIISSVLLLTTPACKKSKGDDGLKAGTISFKANGEAKTFEVAAFWTYPDGNDYVCYMVATMEDNEAAEVSIRITSSQPITAKTYNSDSDDELEIEFHDEDEYHYTNENSSVPSSIIISKITEDNIQGTFSGTLIGQDAESLTITDGKFNCPVLR